MLCNCIGGHCNREKKRIKQQNIFACFTMFFFWLFKKTTWCYTLYLRKKHLYISRLIWNHTTASFTFLSLILMSPKIFKNLHTKQAFKHCRKQVRWDMCHSAECICKGARAGGTEHWSHHGACLYTQAEFMLRRILLKKTKEEEKGCF